MAVELSLLAPLLIHAAVRAGDTGCTAFEQSTGGCSTTGTNAGDHVDIGGHAGADSGDQGTAGDSSDDPPGPRQSCPTSTGVCLSLAQLELNPPEVGIDDLASFYPAAPTIASEPNGWAVTGLDANFVVGAKTHTASGPLLGRDADVRFTPARFRWDFGDGIRSTTTTAGRTWHDLGLPDFSPTTTSHVYAVPGSYDVDVAVEYTAEFRVGGGAWRDIPGVLTLPAPTSTIVAADAATVLVQRTCRSDPRGIGC